MAQHRPPQPIPEQVLRALAAQFDAAAAGHEDVASHLILGLSGLIAAVETFLPGCQADVADELAAAIGRAVPAIQAHTVAGPKLVAACAHGAMGLAAMLGQSYDEAHALVLTGQPDAWLDLVGLQRAGLEAVWRAGRLGSLLPVDEPNAVEGVTALAVGTKH